MCAFRTSVARELTATAPHVLLGVSQTSPVTGLRIPLHWSALRVIALVYPAETVRVARFAVRTLTETGVLLVASKITSSPFAGAWPQDQLPAVPHRPSALPFVHVQVSGLAETGGRAAIPARTTASIKSSGTALGIFIVAPHAGRLFEGFP